jgi:hypothetical protein
MRQLDEHKVNPANDLLTVAATDTPGSGGAHHRYVIGGFSNENNPSKFTVDEPASHVVILFQNGAINEVGVNGVTHEALIAILVDRLEGFQRVPYAHDDNAIAHGHLMAAQAALQRRTRERMARGVEGTHTL